MTRQTGITGALSGCVLALVLCGCPGDPPVCDPEVDDCFDGGVVDDPCNTVADALANAECLLAPMTDRQAFIGPPIDGAVDNDFYRINLPATLTARSLVHVAAGYGASNTAVNLSVSVLNEAGTTSIARAIDQHGQAAPRPIDMIVPVSAAMAGKPLVLLLADEGATPQKKFDARSPYSVRWEPIENPDGNEPNDTAAQATPIPLSGTPPTGAIMGAALATDNDVDNYSFAAPTSGRKIIYLHITAPVDLMKPPPYRLSFTMFDPAGVPVAEGSAPNQFTQVDLAAAKLATGAAGNYRVEVKGFKPENDPTVIHGDLNLKYTVSVQIFDDLDTNEGNDTRAAADAKAISLSVGQGQTISGKLSYVPDPEWFAFNVSGSLPAVLRVRASVSGTAGRFAPISALADHQLRIFKAITTGATPSDRVTACKNDNTLCPKGYEGSDQQRGLVEALCASDDPAPCLMAERDEFVGFANMRNFEARVPITVAGKYYVLFQDDGNNYADDRDWALEVSLDADPDDSSRAGLPNQTATSSVSNGSFPTPPASGEISGALTYGYGRTLAHDPNKGEGTRAPTDYDGVVTDIDRFQLDFPGGTMGDRTWTLQWDIAHNTDGGKAPGDLSLDVEFCDGTRTAIDGGTCATVLRSIAFQDGRIQPWYGQGLTDRTVIWERVETPSTTTVTATANGCFCFEPRFTSAGKYFVRVGAVDRDTEDTINYRVRQGIAAYPQMFTGDGGAAISCPAPSADAGGCRFAGNN